MMGINAVKAVEIGDGYSLLQRVKGYENNDQIRKMDLKQITVVEYLVVFQMVMI